MRIKSSWLILIGCCTVITGCSSLYVPHPHIEKMEAGSVISSTAAVRDTFVHNPDGKLYVCAGPAPDAGFSQNEYDSVSISLVQTGGQDAASEAEGSAEEEFSGRSPSVLLTRELLYRLCEFVGNNNLDERTAVELYKLNLHIIEQVSMAVAENTKIEISDSVSNSEVAEISGGQPQNGRGRNKTGNGSPDPASDPDPENSSDATDDSSTNW